MKLADTEAGSFCRPRSVSDTQDGDLLGCSIGYDITMPSNCSTFVPDGCKTHVPTYDTLVQTIYSVTAQATTPAI